ncbi:MAG: molybdenum cofactor guanylyltransferase, partial [Actinobacteria bacterium]|nr:molybdenum cofactor guanylyltransferase [Actinomycetota bacterium]NIS32067.1 molybdenum cofactor guanylyltransferase [Actinomycetota bacterium]NIU67137.1 molybdenum cofactor guanylyltransferase [Actinomycetota bacterium]NIW28916.1 molybdenum cofactor guanylyltransferase [Actinomycetota bacterium]NIX21397.1 molybdenum cofactor guanylyltransferase [Actinomycetota bacterium]
MLDDWVAAVSEELGLEVEVDIRRLLDVARVAAHNVDRPAAPLTTFLLGYAAGRHGAVDP